MWMKQLLMRLCGAKQSRNAGLIGAGIGFGFGLMWVLLGFFQTLFILILSGIGYILGMLYFSDKKSFENLIDKIFPPGFFR